MTKKTTNIVNIYNEHNYDIKNFDELAKAILNTLSTKLKADIWWGIAIIFNDEVTSCNLNKDYRGKDYVPDVLAFTNNNDDVFPNFETETKDLGDIYICYPKAVLQAKAYGHSLIREISFLFLHGLLHTLGYDHQTSSEEKNMFGLQDKVLTELNITRK